MIAPVMCAREARPTALTMTFIIVGVEGLRALTMTCFIVGVEGPRALTMTFFIVPRFKQKIIALSFRRPYVNFAHLGPEQVQGARAKSQNPMFRGSGRKLM